jgi:hypothetical protein
MGGAIFGRKPSVGIVEEVGPLTICSPCRLQTHLVCGLLCRRLAGKVYTRSTRSSDPNAHSGNILTDKVSIVSAIATSFPLAAALGRIGSREEVVNERRHRVRVHRVEAFSVSVVRPRVADYQGSAARTEQRLTSRILMHPVNVLVSGDERPPNRPQNGPH